jgi:protein TonB
MARVKSRAGDWHYAGLARQRISWLAVLFSAGVHALLLWGGGPRPAPKHTAVASDERIVQMVMPPLEEDKDEPVEELEAAEETPAVEVPRLVDLPSAVTLNSFVQPLDTSSALQTSVDASKLTSIPVHIATGAARPGTGLKNLFDISQLDRVPEPIAQPEPIFPANLRKDVDRAEVIIEFIVDTKGFTRDVRAISSTHTGFEQAAIDGVSRWRFRPGMKDGRKVNTRVHIPIRFMVTGEDS